MQAHRPEAGASKTLQCLHCNRTFTRPENLSRHVRTHEAIRPHRCQTCGKQFARSDLRRKHERLHDRPASSPKARRGRSRTKPTNSITALNETSDQLFDPSLENVLPNGTWEDGSQVDPYFDYASFAKPWNYTVDPATDASGWFSNNFFAALRETDLAFSPPFPSFTEHTGLITSSAGPLHRQEDDTLHAHIVIEGSSGRASRAQSPPNEASHEDRTPFAWDPRSKPVAKATPIVLRPDDPIFAVIDQKLEIAEDTLSRMREFLRPQERDVDDESFTIPTLPLVNTFITLFFNEFSPQSPVLHRPTVDINALPSALLAIIMVIGSVYSHLRHTRRFGIVVLDRIRQNLNSLIENDNSLMREPLIIYACALVCYMGLWCGNKRAFELAEALRAAVVTYTKRLSFESQDHYQRDKQGNLQGQWLGWISSESRKRLRWFVFMLDSQFFTILGMSGMMTLADARKWECPCDEDFWSASSARSWKNLLGSASEPSCPIFGPVAALLLNHQKTIPVDWSKNSAFPRMNSWSAKLLLTAIMAEVFHHEQILVVTRMTGEEDFGNDSLDQSNMYKRAIELFGSLETWHEVYARAYVSTRSDPTSSYFHRVSIMLLHLGRIYLHLPLSDLQDCIGRSGPIDASEAMKRLALWATNHFDQGSSVVQEAAMCISFIMNHQDESSPYNLIALFLCHIAIWTFANAASVQQRVDVARALRENPSVSSHVCEFIEAGFSITCIVGTAVNTSNQDSQLIFKHAIQVLVQLGSWGASSNLALLLHLQSEPPHSGSE